MKVKVTRKHIREGFTYSCRRCPIALALTELLNPDSVVSVDGTTATFWLGVSNRWNRNLSRSAKRFIWRYDTRMRKADPFTFQIDIPAQVLK